VYSIFFMINDLQIQLSCFEGLYGQHKGKKPKLMRPLDNPLDNIVPLTNSIPSPAASQMSNMSSPNKFIKIISGRDRGRKTKSLKVKFLYDFRCSCASNFCFCNCANSIIIFLLFFTIRLLLDSLVLEVLGHYLKIRWCGVQLPYQIFSLLF